jgi:hypothetical protein
MGVEKFRTFEAAERALWLPAGDPRILPRLTRLAELARPPAVSRGVTRFRTIDEAKAGKWVMERP